MCLLLLSELLNFSTVPLARVQGRRITAAREGFPVAARDGRCGQRQDGRWHPSVCRRHSQARSGAGGSSWMEQVVPGAILL